MDVELTKYISHLIGTLKNPPTKGRFFQNRLQYKTLSAKSRWKEDGANVFREPKEVNQLTSNLERCCRQKTKMPFSYDGYHMRCYGLLRDPVVTAICDRCLVIGYLR